MSSDIPTNSPRERFVFLGSCLVLAAALLVGMAREQQWGTRWVPLHLLSPNADGLRSGQEVRISGIAVGKVQALQLQQDAQVKVTLEVQEQHADLIGPDSVASLGQEGLVGDHFVMISADPQDDQPAARVAGRTLPYEQPLAINNLMHRLVDTQTELQATLRNTTRLTGRELPATLQSVNKLAGTVERETAATTPQLQQTLQKVSSTASSAEQTSRQVQQLLQQSQPLLISTLRDLKQVASSSRRIMQSLQQLLGISVEEIDSGKRGDH
jgi:phospholipid/cholesterol/gamma-HCH transport system substrate-binding protein